jgi:O-methyltransferase
MTVMQSMPVPGIAEALAQHQSGNLAAAELGYRKVLATQPDDGWALHLLAVLLLQRVGVLMPEALNLIDRFIQSPVANEATLSSSTNILDELLRILAPRINALHKAAGTIDERIAFLCRVIGVPEAEADRFFFGDRLASIDKSCGFLADSKFTAAFNRNAEQTGEEPGRAWRLHTLAWAAKHALKLEGDFVECGVFEGFMSSTLAEYLDFGKCGKTFYLYDTFEGFSPKYSSPADFGVHHEFFAFAQSVYGRPGLHASVVERFKQYPNIKVIRGVVPDVLLQESPAKIAYCHIDLNSPAAEVGALNVLFDRIVPGGIVIFDDYGWREFAKQKDAEDVFAAERGYTILELPTGQGMLIKR